MHKGTALLLTLILMVAPPAFGCSNHGEAAAASVNAWMGSGTGFTVTGDQEQTNGDNSGGSTWGAHNDWYTVTITAPGNPGETITFTANPMDFTGAGDLEHWLVESAKDWILDNAPDQKLADFVG